METPSSSLPGDEEPARRRQKRVGRLNEVTIGLAIVVIIGLVVAVAVWPSHAAAATAAIVAIGAVVTVLQGCRRP